MESIHTKCTLLLYRVQPELYLYNENELDVCYFNINSVDKNLMGKIVE